MAKFIKITMLCIVAVLASIGLVAPAAADVSIRDSSAGDLYVSSDVPSVNQIERQFAAFWNPNIGMDPKVEVSYNGAGARAALEQVMANSATMDFFSIQGRAVGPVQVNGDRASVQVEGVMAGFPATSTTYHYIREGGLWKFDWKAICQSMSCAGNPSFGY